MKNRKQAFSRNQIGPGMNESPYTGSQPPRNSTVISAQSIMTLMYSPRKNSRNGVDEYSTMKPATSSDSASSRSNGGRCVSASDEMKKITNIGNSIVNANQQCSCACTMA